MSDPGLQQEEEEDAVELREWIALVKGQPSDWSMDRDMHLWAVSEIERLLATIESRDQRIHRLAEVTGAASHLIDGWDYYVELVEMGFPPANALETALDALLPGDLDV